MFVCVCLSALNFAKGRQKERERERERKEKGLFKKTASTTTTTTSTINFLDGLETPTLYYWITIALYICIISLARCFRTFFICSFFQKENLMLSIIRILQFLPHASSPRRSSSVFCTDGNFSQFSIESRVCNCVLLFSEVVVCEKRGASVSQVFVSH